MVRAVLDRSIGDPEATLRPHRIGHDPTTLLGSGEFWRATLTPHGAATLHLHWTDGRLDAEAWGPGGAWILERAADYLGASDAPFTLPGDSHPAVVRALRRHPRLALSNGHCLYHTLLPTILAQRVTSLEAARSWRSLCLHSGEAAPGPLALVLPPDPEALARMPYWAFHRLGIERQRADIIRRTAVVADRIFALDDAAPNDAAEFLGRIAGIGPWTIGAALGHALGDPDAVAVGDFHLKNTVAWALADRPRGTDGEMLALLERYRGQRGRVIRLLAADGWQAPKFAPRRRIVPIRDL
jgi:hypothetical protein